MKNNSDKFHPDWISNDRTLGYFEDGQSNNRNNNKSSSDTRSVPDLKRYLFQSER